jgi:hypothetical protein
MFSTPSAVPIEVAIGSLGTPAGDVPVPEPAAEHPQAASDTTAAAARPRRRGLRI